MEGSPLIGQRYRRGRHTLTIRPPGVESDRAKDYRLPEIRPGRWHDMVCHVRYSAADDGTIEVWMDGARVVSYAGPTASPRGADRFYNKIGLYRDRWKQSMTIYFDDYALGESFEVVKPGRRGGGE